MQLYLNGLRIRGSQLQMFYKTPRIKRMKRLFDMVLVIPMLVLLAPVFFLLVLMIYFKLGSPIFFQQIRPGKNGNPFAMIKFRTMTEDRDQDGLLLPDVERLTCFGRFLRSSSLDELPGLWNVIKGDMSLIGPRPLLMEYLPLYSTEQARRHEILPGITGWAQVNGRNLISWEEKFKLDVWYVDHQSLWFDIKILWLTVLKVFYREGVSQDGHATMGKFRGSL